MYKRLKKFATKEDVDNMIGTPKVQINHLPIYYYGEGSLVAYAPYKFKIENNRRMEYGEKGNYAVAFYHFNNVDALKDILGVDTFEAENTEFLIDIIPDEDITYTQSFEDIQRKDLKKKYVGNYMEGETRRLVAGKMKIINLFIMYGTFTLYFCGKSKKSKLCGFKYTL